MNATSFEQFRYPMMIKEHHLDTFGHVNNASYLEILEEARWEFLNTRGFDLETIHRTQMGPVVLECRIKFLRELQLREHIVIHSQVTAYERKVGTMLQEIYNQENTLCCQADFCFGFFDLKTRKLILPSAEWLHAIGSFSHT